MSFTCSGDNLLFHLRRSLQHLYDPAELRRSVVFELLNLPIPEDRVTALRSLLQNAIREFKPDAKAPVNPNHQRAYDILTYRFIEQSSQKEVAVDLALSLRQVQRLETAALKDLAESIASKYSLTLFWSEAEPETIPPEQFQQELDWLKKTYRFEKINLTTLLEPILSTLAPLLHLAPIEILIPPDLPPIQGQSTSLQQAILNILSLLLPGGPVSLRAETHKDGVLIEVERKDHPADSAIQEGLSVAQQLVAISGGKLSVSEGNGLKVSLMLQSFSLPLILGIDDNQDALTLLERHLTGSEYQFLGTRDPESLLTLVEKHRPEVVLLDVMLPGTDGWSLLARMKSHTGIDTIPVILTTILPQENLALALGAQAFLRKPYTREDLLSILARILQG
jgi:CheY-like chemotaxis protein